MLFRVFLLNFMLILAPFCAYSASFCPSLMFTAHECETVESARATKLQTTQNGPAITCDAILYMDPQNWTIWVNGQKITSNQKHPEFQVVSVKEGQVELLWTTKGQAMPVILGVGDMQLAHNLESTTQLAKR